MTDFVVAFLLVTGVLFVFLAGIGALRFQDPLMRMAAISKASTLGLTLILLGVALEHGSWHEVWKTLAIIFVLWVSTPVVAHLLARSALKSGLKLSPRTQNLSLIEEITDA